MNYCNNNLDKLYLNCPFDIIEFVSLDLQKFMNFSTLKMQNYINFTNSLILFSLNEYYIYNKYNQFIITFACLLIGISSDFDNSELNGCEKENNKNLLKDFIKRFNFIDLSIIEECEKEILFIIDNSSDDDENEFDITRPNSLNSLFDIINNEQLKEDNNNSKNLITNEYSYNLNDQILNDLILDS